MELLAKMKVDNIYKSKDYLDKQSGETTPGKWKIQTFDKVETEEGEQMKLLDISIPESLAKSLKSKVGETVTIPVAPYISNGRVGYYGLE
jgi:hypothetical protein